MMRDLMSVSQSELYVIRIRFVCLCTLKRPIIECVQIITGLHWMIGL